MAKRVWPAMEERSKHAKQVTLDILEIEEILSVAECLFAFLSADSGCQFALF